MAPKKFKVAVIQLWPKPLQNEDNFKKASAFIRDAATQGCALAVLPEYHLDGWVPSDPAFFAGASHSGTYLAAYQALAKELHICIVPGTILEQSTNGGSSKSESEGDGEGDGDADQASTLLNVAYFISADGSVLASYQKKNLWHPERPHLTSSAHDAHLAFDTPLGRCGLLICWDLAFPEAFRALIADGAEVIIIPTFWTHGDCSPAGLAHNARAESLFIASTVVSRTFENTCVVVFCNAGGPPGRTKPGTFCGLSQVAVPFKGALGLLGEEEGMSVVDVDLQLVKDAEENYKVREDMQREGWHYAYTLEKPDEAKAKL